MQLITLDDLNGHWRTTDGCCHLWIASKGNRVQMYENNNLVFDDPLSFEYVRIDNVCTISKSILLWMLSPKDGNVFLQLEDGRVLEFTR